MMNNAVSASHDTHLLKIDNREDELLTRINSWKSALMKSVGESQELLNIYLGQFSGEGLTVYRYILLQCT